MKFMGHNGLKKWLAFCSLYTVNIGTMDRMSSKHSRSTKAINILAGSGSMQRSAILWHVMSMAHAGDVNWASGHVEEAWDMQAHQEGCT